MLPKKFKITTYKQICHKDYSCHSEAFKIFEICFINAIDAYDDYDDVNRLNIQYYLLFTDTQLS